MSAIILFQPWWAFYTTVFTWCFSLFLCTCWWLGKVFMASSSSCVMSPGVVQGFQRPVPVWWGWTHRHWLPAARSVWPDDSSSPTLPLQMERAGTWVSIWRNAVIFASMRTFRMSGLGFSMAWVRLKRWKRALWQTPLSHCNLLNASQICVSLASPVTCKNRTKIMILQSPTKNKQHVIRIVFHNILLLCLSTYL